MLDLPRIYKMPTIFGIVKTLKIIFLESYLFSSEKGRYIPQGVLGAMQNRQSAVLQGRKNRQKVLLQLSRKCLNALISKH